MPAEAGAARGRLSDLARFNLHCGAHAFAMCMGTMFTGVFLLRQGLSVAAVFLVFGAVVALRVVLRPLALAAAPRIGLKGTLALGCVFYAGQYLLLPAIGGLDAGLALYCLVSGFSNVFYWTTYHALFAALSDSARMGRQVGWRQLLTTAASVAGPIAGGALLASRGPWAAFGIAAALMLASILPLLGVREPGLSRHAPAGAYVAGRRAALLFATDGWIGNTAANAWGLAVFQTLGQPYDAFGWLIAAAALSGALAGLALGRFIDLGHGRRAVALNAALGSALFLAQARGAGDVAAVSALAIAGAFFGALYLPSLMAVVYRAARAAPCVFRFHFVLEGGWDAGGVAGCLAAAGLSAIGAPPAIAIGLAIPALLAQALLLARDHPPGR